MANRRALGGGRVASAARRFGRMMLSSVSFVRGSVVRVAMRVTPRGRISKAQMQSPLGLKLTEYLRDRLLRLKGVGAPGDVFINIHNSGSSATCVCECVCGGVRALMAEARGSWNTTEIRFRIDLRSYLARPLYRFMLTFFGSVTSLMHRSQGATARHSNHSQRWWAFV